MMPEETKNVTCPDCGKVLTGNELCTSWTQYRVHMCIHSFAYLCPCGSRVLDVQEDRS